MPSRSPAERAFIHGYCLVANTIAGVSIPTDPDHEEWTPILAEHRHVWDQSRHYHEAHITIEPVPDTGPGHAEFDIFRDAFADDTWRVSTFAEDDVDHIEGKWFITCRHESLLEITEMVSAMTNRLLDAGLTVLRAKIEDTIIDTKHGDTL